MCLYNIFSHRNSNVSFQQLEALHVSSIETKRYEKNLNSSQNSLNSFFSIDSITRHINELLSEMQEKGTNIEVILMVGFYSDSPVLRAELRETNQTCNIFCP